VSAGRACAAAKGTVELGLELRVRPVSDEMGSDEMGSKVTSRGGRMMVGKRW
jgi:hypothetical protein